MDPAYVEQLIECIVICSTLIRQAVGPLVDERVLFRGKCEAASPGCAHGSTRCVHVIAATLSGH